MGSSSLLPIFFPELPESSLKYKFETYKYVAQTESPIYIFHGDQDEIIPHQMSIDLQDQFKEGDELVIIPGMDHNGINFSRVYMQRLLEISQGLD